VTSRRISLRKPPPVDVPEPEPAATATTEKVSLGKGRPTPKRSDAQRRRGGPVAPPPATRREAAKRLRAQQAAGRKSLRDGTATLDQSRMLPRDAGPVRALVRDLVDSRRNLGTIMLPVALAFVLGQLTGQVELVAVLSRLFSLVLLLVLADLLVTGILIRRTLRAQFPEERRLRGHVAYGLLRSTVLRRLRMPPTRVKPATLFRR
jgi:hypothetical protein